MRIFVTGASGFVGRAFVREARARDHALLCLSRDGGVAADDGVTVVRGDLESVPYADVERFTPDAVLHLAWIATPGEYLESPRNEQLARQSMTMLAELAKRGVTHLATTGTCIEYAPSERPLSESTSEIAPEFPYSIAKHRLHTWLADQDWGPDTQWSWLRIFYPYGPGEHDGRLTTSFAQRLSAGEPVVLRTPDSTKDFIYATDLASGLCQALESRLAGAVNLGTGEGTSIRALAACVAEAVGAPARLVEDAAERAVDPRPYVVADATRLRETGWQPRVSLREGVSRLVDALGVAAR